MSKTIGLKRNIIDKFYTSPKIAAKCVEYIKRFLTIKKTDLIIEPSAGNGVFIPLIKKLSNNYLFYDIKPDYKKIIKQNYLRLNIKKTTQKIHVIGNPPFGRRSSLAIKFIKKSCEFCDTFSFILPKSFKKNSMQKTIPLNFHLLFQIDLPYNSFTINSNSYHVPCVFQIWVKKNYERKKQEKIISKYFNFVKKNENPDVAIRRVGINAGHDFRPDRQGTG
jgi:predicted RNA methylase